MTEIVKLDPAEYGLTETKASEISALFTPMLDKMVEFEKEYNEVILKKPSFATCEEAKKLRLKYVKVRTGTAAIHKDAKAFYLAGGRFVDGWKNAQLFASQGIEDKLKALEEHYEREAKAERDKIKQARLEQLEPYEVDTTALALDQMSEEVWETYFKGVKATSAEEQERATLELRHRENEEKKLERINKLSGIGMVWIDVLNHYEKDGLTVSKDEILNFTDEEFKIQFDFISGKLDKIAAINAKIDAEEKRIQDEMEAKINADTLAKAVAVAEAKVLAAAPDKEKLLAFANELDTDTMEYPLHVDSDEAKVILDQFVSSIKSAITIFIQQVNQL